MVRQATGNLPRELKHVDTLAHLITDGSTNMGKEPYMKTMTLIPAVFLAWIGMAGPPAQEAQEQAGEEFTESQIVVPEGTVIPIVLNDYINTRNSQVGDIIYADTTYPIWVQQKLVIPKGSTIRATITDIARPGKIKGKGRVAVRFDDILLPNGVKRELIASFRGIHGPGDETVDRKKESVSAASSKGEDAGTIVGTTAQGAAIGAIIGRGSGAAIGSGIGAAAGIATVLFSRGRDLVISPGTRFDLELLRPMKFAFNEIEFTQSQLRDAEQELRQVRTAPANTNSGRRNTRLPGIPGIGGIPY